MKKKRKKNEEKGILKIFFGRKRNVRK